MRKKYKVFVWYPDSSYVTFDCTDLTYVGNAVRFLSDGVWRTISNNWHVMENAKYGTSLL